MDVLSNGSSRLNSNINIKWVQKENRIFSVYPKFSLLSDGSGTSENNIWLQLSSFVIEDLQWILSLEHANFWSHMIYSKEAQNLVVSILRETPPHFMRNYELVDEKIQDSLKTIEHLVFLIFLRLSTEKESENNCIENLGDILYNNYLFTVPTILDLCSFYGCDNMKIVKAIVGKVLKLAPSFLNDFEEAVFHFLCMLKLLKKQMSETKFLDKLKENFGYVKSMVFFLCDLVSSMQMFLECYPKCCKLFCKNEIVSEIVSFYSNVLPQIQAVVENGKTWVNSEQMGNLLDNIRIDLLKIVRNLFEFLHDKSIKEISEKEEVVDEYLTLMAELLSEPIFLSDYNQLYKVADDIYTITKNVSVDPVKVDHILLGIPHLDSNQDYGAKRKESTEPLNAKLDGKICMNSIVCEIKDVLPHLDDYFIRSQLQNYDCDAEKFISAFLDGSLSDSPVSSNSNKTKPSSSKVSKPGRTESDDDEWNSFFRNTEKIDKKNYERWYRVEDETYNDEFDDTYEEDTNVPIREGDEMDKFRRPFVVPRVLRQLEDYEKISGEDEEEEEEDEEKSGKNFNNSSSYSRSHQQDRREGEKNQRDVVGRGRGQGQSKSVQRNRNFKESHKSFMANHNRKKQSNRKHNQGLIPF